MNIVKVVFAFLFTLTQFFAPYFGMLAPGGMEGYFEPWSPEDEYTPDYAVTIEKDPSKDFVILNIADVQLGTMEIYDEAYGGIAEATIRKAVEEVKPDLITMTGDNADCKPGYIRIAQFMDSLGVPWAPVMGNHDGDNGDERYEFWCGYQLYKAKNCVFKYGPAGMGIGNYVINITENGKIIHTLYMMDTHSDTSLPCGGYDHLWDNQLQWYEWAVKGTEKLAGKNVESSIFFHIPCVQYKNAWEEAGYNAETGVYEGSGYSDSFGSKDENICAPNFDSGFFALAEELDSTKNMIAGHDHVNNFSINYQGIQLSYSLKCGPASSWTESKNGGSVLTVSSDGHAVFSHHYVDPAGLDTSTCIIPR